ncbi:7-deoxyloganetin glucosyltransferase-like protein, partial [Tanacetum coccineum]
NLETQVEQLTKDYQEKATNEVPNSSISQCKVIFANDEAPRDETSSNGTNKLHRVSFIFDDNVQVSKKIDEGPSGVLPCQLPLKELSPGSFTLHCIIGSLNIYAMADLDASVNIMPYSMFKCLKLTSLKKTSMLVEMADMSKKAPMGIVKTVLVKINKNMRRQDYVQHKRKYTSPSAPIKKVYMANFVQEKESFNPLEISDDMFLYDSPLCLEFKKYNHLCETDQNNEDTFVSMQGQFGGRKGMSNDPYLRDFEEYKSVFDNEIAQLANEYKFRIGTKGYILGNIWEKCEQVHGGTMYSWHDHGFEEEEQ